MNTTIRLILALAALAAANLSHALTLPVAEDTSSTKGVITKATGTAPGLGVSETKSAFLKFNVAGLAGTVSANDVSAARLTIYIAGVNQTGTLNIAAATSTWKEAVAGRFPPSAPSIGSLSALPDPIKTAKQYLTIDVTTVVKAWLAGTQPDFGFAFVGTGKLSASLSSKEGTKPAMLEIDIAKVAPAAVGSTELKPHLNLGGITTGTFAGSGADLTGIRAASITGAVTSGQLAANLNLGGTTTGTFSGNGAGLLNIDAKNITGEFSVGHTGQGVVKASEYIGDYASAIAVSGSYAYVAGSFGFRVIDISQPTRPVLRGFLPESSMGNGFGKRVRVVGNLVYLANGRDGLRIINVSNPDVPLLVGHVSESDFGAPSVISSAIDVVVSGEYAFVANNRDGLRIVDILDPAQPVAVGHITTAQMGGSYALSVAVSGQYAFVSVGPSETGGLGLFNVVDVTNKNNPAFVRSLALNTGLSVQVDGNNAYVAGYHTQLNIVDIRNAASSLAIAGSIAADEVSPAIGGPKVFRATTIGGFAYVANGTNGISIVDVSNPSSLRATCQISQEQMEFGGAAAGYAVDIAVEGDFAYVANGDSGISVVALRSANAGAFNGNGSLLTDLNAGNITTGTLDDSRLSGNVTLLGSSIDLGSEVTGMLPWASLDKTGSSLADLATRSAAALNSGTLPAGRLSGFYNGITGLGTVSSGTWNGTAITPSFGGTGLTSVGTAGQVLQSDGTSIVWGNPGGTGTVTSIATGNGLSGGPITSTGTVALGPLTADWVQTGPFDIVLNNVGSEIRILGAAGSFFATLNVGNLAADASFTFSGVGGTIWASGNDGSGSLLDADFLDGLSSAAFASASHTHSAADITSGALSDARLSTNVALRSAANTFTGTQTINGSAFVTGGNLGLGTSSPLGLLHLYTGTAVSLAPSALQFDDIIVNDTDSVLGLYSLDNGNFGSAVALKEFGAGGTVVDTWAMQRRTTTGGKAFELSYGPSASFFNNPAMMTVSTSGNVSVKANVNVGAFLAVASTGEIPTEGGTVTPRSGYVHLAPASSVTVGLLAFGTTEGQVLILENTSPTNTVTFLKDETLRLGALTRVLGKEDTLMLVWTNNRWVEVAFSDK